MKHISARAAAVLERVVRDPALLPEVLRKVKSRMTAGRHQQRIGDYVDMVVSPSAGVAKLLRTDMAAVQEVMEAEGLRRVLSELEAYQVPEPARPMGGAAFLEICYAIVRLTSPRVVLETGVAHGGSTAAVLQALQDNGQGVLYSTDLPAFLPDTTFYTGDAIPERLRSSIHWELTVGSDRRVLPSLLQRVGPIDVFLYDSDKSYEGMMHTWQLVWPHVRPGGILVLDDVHVNDAFATFSDALGLDPQIVPKPRGRGVYRWEKTFYVGLLRKADG